MHKNIPLVVGITILFLGLAIPPSIATLQQEKIDLEPDVDDIEGNSDYWRIYGCVRDLLGNKLEKVTVWISTYDLIWSTKTDSDGFYEFTKIPKAIPSWTWYSMLFEKKGYLERPKIILGTMNDDEIEINVVLVKYIFDRAIDHPSLERFPLLERLLNQFWK